MSYALKLAGAAAALLIVGVVGILIFSALWFRIGLGAAVVLVFGGLLFFAWRADKKARESRAGLDRV